MPALALTCTFVPERGPSIGPQITTSVHIAFILYLLYECIIFHLRGKPRAIVLLCLDL